jgi:outer membrane protein, heavy metal efflux system
MRLRGHLALFVVLALAAGAHASSVDANAISSEAGLNADQLVAIAIAANPSVRATKAQWDAAQHQILQNYVPADPVFTYTNLESSAHFNAAQHAHNITENFQFPGEAFLQADQAKRTAQIARLTFEASLRDTRAAVETGYYQVLLDYALISVNAENIDNLRQVLEVTKTAYSAGQHTQVDVINAQIGLAQAELQQRQYETNRANDIATLNQLLFRNSDSPLNLDHTIHLNRLNFPLDDAVNMATRVRQEILESALSEKNANTALTLAKMEYLPNYTVSGEFDYILQPGAQPLPNVTQAYTFGIGFNVPIFFWYHQREDVKSAEYSLQAARYSLESIRLQTQTSVTELYRSAQFAYEQAQLYSASLIPLARQDFKVSLVAYQAGQVDFLTLSAALQASYSTRASYIQNANQFLAGEVALEQAIGAPLPK